MNDITKLKLCGQLYLFCDDISLVISAKTYDELQTKVNNDLSIIANWLRLNRLVLNYDKTNFILMGNPRESSIQCIKPSINNIYLKRIYNTKILGIEIDHNLKFDLHIHKLCKQLNSRLCLISKLKVFLPEKN